MAMSFTSWHSIGTLYRSCSNGDADNVLNFLQRGTDLNHYCYTTLEEYSMGMLETPEVMHTPLHIACKKGYYTIVEHLVHWGIKLDTMKFGRTALHSACEGASDTQSGNQQDCVELLLRNNCRTDIKNKEGETALDLARRLALEVDEKCKGAETESVKDKDARLKKLKAIVASLMEHKPQLSKDPLSTYPTVEVIVQLPDVGQWYKLGVYLGVAKDQLQRIKIKGPGFKQTAVTLLGLSQCDRFGRDPPMPPTSLTLLSAKVHNIELKWSTIVEGLLSIGEYGTVMYLASFYGALSILKNLVETKGQDPKREGQEWHRGKTPLTIASSNGQLDTVKYLIEVHHCDPEKRTSDGDTPLSLASSNGHLDTVKYLAEVHHLCHPETLNCNRQTPLCQAYIKRHLETVKYLVHEQQCDPKYVTDESRTGVALALECSGGDLEMVKALINKKVDPKEPINQAGDTPIALAYKDHHMEVVKYLANSHQCDTKACLLHATEHNERKDVEFLLNECHSDPNVTDEQARTPLDLTNDPIVIKLLLQHGAKASNIYKAHSKLIGKLSSERPPEIPLSVFIVGDGGVGKSTLLKSMLTSPGSRIRLSKPKPVTGVDEKTVGIIPHEVNTKDFGRVTMYDFAGQQEFYASHCAVLENAVQTSPPIIIHCADLQKSEQKIVNSTNRWMTLVQNQCKDLIDKGHVIVVGSHADKLRERNEDPRDKETIFAPIIEQFPKFEFVAFTAMDCRFADSPEMKQVKKYIQSSSALLRSPEAVDFNAHAFQIYLLDRFKDALAVSVKAVQKKIRDDLSEPSSKKTQNLVSLIPSTLARLVEICSQLNKKGLVLYLHNEASPEESFIVCDRTTLLSTVAGTVFAPKGFRQHCKLASSTGLVPLYKFSEGFKSYNIKMLISFMTHLELCFKIKDRQVLDYISKTEQNPDPNGHYLFFPGLITIDTPERVWELDPSKTYYFGWILQTCEDTQFFDPRSFQVLILRLVFTFSLAPASWVQRKLPSLQRFCSVWKRGISWSDDDGITAHVELSDNGKSLALKVRCSELKPECLALRSRLVNKVLETVKEFCPNIGTTESIIDPEQVAEHQLKPASSLTLCTVSHTAVAVVTKKDEVKSMYSSRSLKHLLQFEPYAGLDINTLQSIHSDKSATLYKKISDGFIAHLSTQVNNPGMYSSILCQASAHSTPAAQPSSPVKEMVRSLKRWRNDTEGTYTRLRETLNKYSVFTGRNPLDLAGVSHSEVDPSSLFPDPPAEQEEAGTDLLPLDKVREALKEVHSDWYSLAVELDIDHRTRKAIEKDNSSVEAKFDAMTQHWVRRTFPPPTWAALVGALKSPAIGRGDVAESIPAMPDVTIETSTKEASQAVSLGNAGQLNVDKHLKMVRTASWEMRSSWDKLAVELDITEGKWKAIEHDHHHVSGPCYTALLETWLTQTSPPPTLGALIGALKSPVIRRADIASNIEHLS